LLGPSSRLPEFFQPEVYQPMIEAFCKGDTYSGIPRQGLYQRAIMFLSVHLTLSGTHPSRRALDYATPQRLTHRADV
jgi:hypothetical protein